MMLRRFLYGGLPSSLSLPPSLSSTIVLTFLIALVIVPAQAADVLETDGFSTCLTTDDIVVNMMKVKYDRANGTVAFNLSGTSKKRQNVTAILTVTAYGRQIYEQVFDPCKEGIQQLCPLPEGTFAAKDSLIIPDAIAKKVPAIAFQIPDIEGVAKLELKSVDNGSELACLQSVVQNGKTANVREAKYATACIAGAALLVTGLSALGAAGGASAAGGVSGVGPSPNFGDVMFWFQSIAMDGMLSIQYPSVYRSFSDNFQWSTGLFSWDGMQHSIDSFRGSTGGNTTTMSIEYLLNNSTLVYDKQLASNATTGSNSGQPKMRRNLDYAMELIRREVLVNGTNLDGTKATPPPQGNNKVMRYVEGIQAKVETLQIPSANTFMTVLLAFCCVIAGVAVCILLAKLLLEFWALFGSFPKTWHSFRKRYWMFLMTTIVRIVLILYGTWTLYCLYQFKAGDSWACNALAGVALGLFTLVLGFFIWRIFSLAIQAKKLEGGQEQLFIHKPYMRKYGLFYDQFKSNFWWVFVPLIIYAFAKGAFIALGDGHGLFQTIGQLSCEVFLLLLLLWSRPYNTKAGNVLNIIISCARVLSVVCLIVFVDQMGIAPDTKTITGVALIAIQSTLTAVLAICIAVNAIYAMVQENPLIKKRREQEKRRKELSEPSHRQSIFSSFGQDGKGEYQPTPTHDQFALTDTESGQGTYPLHHMTPAPEHPIHNRNPSGQGLIGAAAPMSVGEYSPPHQDYEEYQDHHPQYHDHHPQYHDHEIGTARAY